jgi:hypothetical protein
MATETKKITKRTQLATLDAIVTAAEAEGIALSDEDITYESLHEFIAKEVELLDNKAAAAAKRAAAKKVEGDELREKIYSVLSDTDFMTVQDIVKALNDEDISAPMVIARLTQLASPEVNRITKETVTVPPANEGGKSKKLTAYRKIG